MKDLAQDVAKDVFGAAKDGSAKVVIVTAYLAHRRGTRATLALR